MSVLDIVRLGHPALRTPAEPVPEADLGGVEIRRLIDDLVETMYAAEGVGLAAPQVGIGLQLFVYDPATSGRGEGEAPGARAVVNPMISPEAGDLVYDWEGCLSIPDLRGLVPRHPAVRVRGFDRDGAPLDYPAEGFAARVVQHENDHLNGIVFLDRMRDLRSLAFYDEWERYLVGEGEPSPPGVG